MNIVGNTYQILFNEELLLSSDFHAMMPLFPGLKPGLLFKVVEVDPDVPGGITGISYQSYGKTKYINVHDRQGHDYWCLFLIGDDSSNCLQLIGKEPESKSKLVQGQIIMNHFHNRPVDIAYALSSIAGQENCDFEEYTSLMQKASEYIRFLEENVQDK